LNGMPNVNIINNKYDFFISSNSSNSFFYCLQ
jgi:hypothetical protein